MLSYERLWEFRTANFAAVLECAPEPDPDLSWDEDGEVAAKLESGEFVNVLFRVRVLSHGHELGSDYLGNSIYEDPADFRREHIGAQGRYGSYFKDMVHEAIREARQELAKLQSIRVHEPA